MADADRSFEHTLAAVRTAAEALRQAGWKLDDSDLLVVAVARDDTDHLYALRAFHEDMTPETARAMRPLLIDLLARVTALSVETNGAPHDGDPE